MFNWIGKWIAKRIWDASVAEANAKTIEVGSDAHALLAQKAIDDWVIRKQTAIEDKVHAYLHGIVGWVRKRCPEMQAKTEEQVNRFIDIALTQPTYPTFSAADNLEQRIANAQAILKELQDYNNAPSLDREQIQDMMEIVAETSNALAGKASAKP